MNLRSWTCAAVIGSAFLPLAALASSHREAPTIAGLPRTDATDFYMFRSYEPGRANYVTFIANYIPFQSPQGGPNFYDMDAGAVYDINIDNQGNGQPDPQRPADSETAAQHLDECNEKPESEQNDDAVDCRGQSTT